MKSNRTAKLALAGVLTAVAVVGSFISFPLFGSKCAPVQHLVNVICAILLGPGYGVAVAFCASLLRNLLGLGSLMAFPGSMIGALCCGLVYKYSRKVLPTLAAEIIGTGVIGGTLAYPVAVLLMGVDGAAIGTFVYVVPFLISTCAGSVLAGILVYTLRGTGTLQKMQRTLGQETVR
ncbi:MAG: energy coupling factor transporter S component ThiW [Lachnospiraceae bacterium]|nr:energy coupling factor transporter S component ThiW [Lachnospiraceae bacterium]